MCRRRCSRAPLFIAVSGKRAKQQTSTGSPGASTVRARRYIGDRDSGSVPPWLQYIYIYLLSCMKAIQELRESSAKLATRGPREAVVVVPHLQLFQSLARTRGQHPEF
jgi:hypothetical protein